MMRKEAVHRRNGTASRLKCVCAILSCVLFLILLAPATVEAKSAFEKACGSFPCSVSDSGVSNAEDQSIAVDESGFSKALQWLRATLSTWQGILGTFNEYLGEKVPAALEKQAAMSNAGMSGMIKASTKLMGAEIDAVAAQSRMETDMKAVAMSPLSQATEQFMCNRIVACQAPNVMSEFARLVSRMVAEGINMRYRDAEDDGAGPQYAGDHIARKVERGYGNPMDGIDEEIAAKSSSSQTSSADADISVLSLDLANVLQVPHMKSVTETLASGRKVTVNVPDINEGSTSEKDIAEKKAWLAAVDYCMTVAGPRPTPPSGASLDTSEGRTKRVAWEHCASMQNEFIHICADRIGMLSRPDCGSPAFEGICEASLHSCNAARDAKAELPPSLRNCADGASLYEAEFLCNSMCESSRQSEAGANVGRQASDMMADMALCSTASTVWKRKVQLQEQAFLEAVDAMLNLESCWPK